MKTFLSELNKQKEKRYTSAKIIIQKLLEILVKKYDVKKVVLIGSCLNEKKFNFHSDIDLVVKGLPDNAYFKAVGELLIAAGEFEVDIIPIENANERMQQYIKQGDILYEK
ncbi:MAG: nucleotidyltransferase domain-containing protein [bacterium]